MRTALMRPGRAASLLVLAVLAACANDPAAHVPPFARHPYQPLSRAAVVAIAEREWRSFGSPVEDPAAARTDDKPERDEGLWQRVGEYWWLGQDAGTPEDAWTGKHDAQGRAFPPENDETFAWSAAFVSYVMRIAGAGDRFPYAVAHHTYIDDAREVSLGRTNRWSISAEDPAVYAPQPGDLICMSRGGRVVHFADLPAGRFAGHCDVVVAVGTGTLDAIGGNVGDAVTLKHVPLTEDGHVADPSGHIVDPRYNWFVVLRLLTPT
jgi:hypothetical protein